MIKELENINEKDFDSDALPEIWKLHQDWCKLHANETRYVQSITDYIVKEANIPAEHERKVYHQVYLANHQEDRIKEQAHAKDMLIKGYIPITNDIEYRGKILLNASNNGILGTHKIEQEATIIIDGSGRPFIVPKGKRSKGWYLQNLDNAFYKPLKTHAKYLITADKVQK